MKLLRALSDETLELWLKNPVGCDPICQALVTLIPANDPACDSHGLATELWKEADRRGLISIYDI
jgi:hypothetical protein